ncbi:MAG TPA: galactose-1-phosphate uridylyltransferase [Streptosporangiaceae bacterium]
MWKNTGKLADGREIIYFDETPGRGRADVPDTRDPGVMAQEAGGPGSRLRWDPLVGEWVIVAAQRQDRTFLPPPDACPLDASAPGRPTEIPAADYDVVVFENRFPSLRGAGAGPAGAGPADTGEHALLVEREAAGRCEVICFTSDHHASFAQLSPDRVRTVVEAWVDRSAVLGGLDGVRQVYCFENRGEEIGVTLHHPHGQIYAFGFVTPRMRRMLSQARRYRARTGGNLFDDLTAAELADGARLVTRNEHWTAFVPAAARWPYEVLIFPVRRVPDLTALGDDARNAFCGLYLDVLGRLDALFGAPLPYIAAWHQAPVSGEPGRAEFGMHLQVLSVRRAPGKLKYLAGTESGTGVWINDIVPEVAARRLREAG